MNKLPTEVVDIIFKIVHKHNINQLNIQFKQFISCAKFHHILQEHRGMIRYNFLKTVCSMMKSLEFSECCFRYPKSIKHLKI